MVRRLGPEAHTCAEADAISAPCTERADGHADYGAASMSMLSPVRSPPHTSLNMTAPAMDQPYYSYASEPSPTRARLWHAQQLSQSLALEEQLTLGLPAAGGGAFGAALPC